MSLKKRKKYCGVPTCANESNSQKNLLFFSLPKKEDRRHQWLQLIGGEDYEYLGKYNSSSFAVCEEHFPAESITRNSCRKVLIPNVVPSLRLPHFITNYLPLSSPTEITENTSTDIPEASGSYLSNDGTDTDTIMAVMSILDSESNKPAQSRKIESKETQLLLTATNSGLGFLNKARGEVLFFREDKRYYEIYRSFCLKLYYTSTRNYHLIQRAVGLPDVITLFEYLPTTTQINHRWLSALQIKIAQMTDLEKDCVMLIDSAHLTPCLSYNEKEDRIDGFHEINGVRSPSVADKVVLVMVRGMFSDWKQPIGYALLSTYVKDPIFTEWINKLKTELINIGLNVRVLNVVTVLDIVQKRWKNHTKQKQFYQINDPSMLIKMTRNFMLSYNLHFDDRVAKFGDILQFYKKDICSKYRLAPKLTHSHICPGKSELNKASVAVELLSKSVASGLSAYIDAKEIDEAARGTVELLTKINELFDCLNSCNDKNANRLFCNCKSQELFLKEMYNVIEGWGLLNSANEMQVRPTDKLVLSYQTTIRSVLYLMENLKLKNHNLLPVNMVSQGITENFFNQIRLRNGNPTNLNVQQFEADFRKLYILSIIQPLKGRNTLKNRDKFLMYLKKGMKRYYNYPIQNEEESNDAILDIPISNSEVSHIDSPEKHTLVYVSGFLLKKCRDKHKNCEILYNYVEGIGENVTLQNISRYLQYSRRNNICLMAIPCDDFLEIVEIMEAKFRKVFKRHQLKNKLEETLSSELERVDFTLPCPCFPKTYLIRLFIRVRVAYTLQVNTREWSRNLTQIVLPLLLSIISE